MAPQKPNALPKSRASSKKCAPNPIKVRKEKKEKKCKQIFAGMSMCATGNFATENCDWTHEMIKRWVEAHGAEWETEVIEDTTHLICSVEDYKKKTQQVRRAAALGPRCIIVERDWLVACLGHGLAKEKRAVSEKSYMLGRVQTRIDKGLERKQEYRARFEEGVRASQEFSDNKLHHVYCDPDGFEYKIVCTRVNDFGRAKMEKYTIFLFESHAKPSHYMTGAKLNSDRATQYWRQKMAPTFFNVALADFKDFFKEKTGLDWDNRCDEIVYDDAKFRYEVPTKGPRGLLPFGNLTFGKFPSDLRPIVKQVARGQSDTEMTDVNAEDLNNNTNSEDSSRSSSSTVSTTFKSGSSSSSSSSSKGVISITSSSSSKSVISISSFSNPMQSSEATDRHRDSHELSTTPAQNQEYSSSSSNHHGSPPPSQDDPIFDIPSFIKPREPTYRTRLPKAYRVLGIPAYDSHLVSMEKRYTFPWPHRAKPTQERNTFTRNEASLRQSSSLPITRSSVLAIEDSNAETSATLDEVFRTPYEYKRPASEISLERHFFRSTAHFIRHFFSRRRIPKVVSVFHGVESVEDLELRAGPEYIP